MRISKAVLQVVNPDLWSCDTMKGKIDIEISIMQILIFLSNGRVNFAKEYCMSSGNMPCKETQMNRQTDLKIKQIYRTG